MTFIHTDRVLFRNNIKSVGLLQRKVLSLVWECCPRIKGTGHV
jgi:hypothetical protein